MLEINLSGFNSTRNKLKGFDPFNFFLNDINQFDIRSLNIELARRHLSTILLRGFINELRVIPGIATRAGVLIVVDVVTGRTLGRVATGILGDILGAITEPSPRFTASHQILCQAGRGCSININVTDNRSE